MRGKPGGYDLPGPPIEVSTTHDANTRLFFIYALPLYYCVTIDIFLIYFIFLCAIKEIKIDRGKEKMKEGREKRG